MDKEDIIKKWLNGSLNEEEEAEFKKSKEYKDLTRLDKSLLTFKAPQFIPETEYSRIELDTKPKLPLHKAYVSQTNWLRLAAVFLLVVVAGGVAYFWLQNPKQEVIFADSKMTYYLPDSTEVQLNIGAELSYNMNKWSVERVLELNGEAFFDVRKGNRFKVITDYGTITVLGTEFNVFARENFLEVLCLEGRVSVECSAGSFILNIGENLAVYEGQILYQGTAPETEGIDWIQGKSNFTNTPLKIVLSELARQYKIQFDYSGIEINGHFTGSFPHSNLEIALKAVLLPLGVDYKIENGNQITLIENGD